ncbi:MAG: T9SS type A sorting domain-containing protein, partial [Bacteroidota bacterium]
VQDTCGTDSICNSVQVDTLVGLAYGLEPGVDIYPNPTQGRLFVRFTLAESAPVHIRVYGMLGQTLKQIDTDPVQQGQLPLQLEDLPSGHYVVEFVAGELRKRKRIELIR